MNSASATRALGPLLLLAAMWVATLPLVVAAAPGLTTLLPGHSHATMRGVVAAHTHTSGATDDGGCVTAASSEDQIACGADETATFGVLLPGVGTASVTAAAAVLASRLADTAVYRAPAPSVVTPPPRA